MPTEMVDIVEQPTATEILFYSGFFLLTRDYKDIEHNPVMGKVKRMDLKHKLKKARSRKARWARIHE
jgi:hypothetical protein